MRVLLFGTFLALAALPAAAQSTPGQTTHPQTKTPVNPPKTAPFVCPKIESHIDCMPPLADADCKRPDYLQWAQKNCKGLEVTY
jgi:hypothetical protein